MALRSLLVLTVCLASACSPVGAEDDPVPVVVTPEEVAPLELVVPPADELPLGLPATKTVRVTRSVERFGGWFREQGDNNMGTEDDESTEVRVSSRLELHTNTVSLVGNFRCREDDKDWSTFKGAFNLPLYQAPAGYKVVRIKQPTVKTSYEYWKHIGGKHHGLVSLPAGSHWKSLQVRFDSKKSNDSSYVGFSGELDFEVVIVSQNTVRVGAEVKGIGSFRRKWGDDEMNTQPGRKTDLTVSSELLLNVAQTEVRIRVSFKCRERSGDETRYEGEVTRTVYTAPAGRRILGLDQPAKHMSYAYHDTIEGQAHGFFDLPVTGSHWALLQCRVDGSGPTDGHLVGFEGWVDFQVVLD